MAISQSFTGEVINPIIDARLRLGLTASALAKRIGVSKQYISRAEQGTYSSLNPALEKWTSRALSINTIDVSKRYQKFQHATRMKTVEDVNPHRLERQNSQASGHALFENWRSGYWPSSLAFAKAFCIHPDIVQTYEDGLRPEMPHLIRDTLTQFNLIGDGFEIGGPPTRGSQRPSKAPSGRP